MRIAILTPIPTPYRDPFWLHLGRRKDITLRVLYCAAGKSDRPWQRDSLSLLDARAMRGLNLLAWRGPDASCYWNASLHEELDTFGPDVVFIGGYNHLTMLAAMRWARRRRVPYVLMCETWQMRSKGVKAWLRNLLIGCVMRRAAGVLPTGSRALGFVVHHSGSDKPFCKLPNVPDIQAITEGRHPNFQTSSTARVLFVGRLIPKKRVADLIKAFATLPEGLAARAKLELIGDGTLRPKLTAEVQRLGMSERIQFRGFLQSKDVLQAYRNADIFVMPSTETWGVAPIEAAASGLRVVISDQVGCVDDLECFQQVDRFPCGDVAALRACLETQIRSVLDGTQRQQADWSVWTYTSLADELVRFLRQITP